MLPFVHREPKKVVLKSPSNCSGQKRSIKWSFRLISNLVGISADVENYNGEEYVHVARRQCDGNEQGTEPITW